MRSRHSAKPEFNVNKALIKEVRQALREKNAQKISRLLPSHAADIAQLIKGLSRFERKSFGQLMKGKLNPEVLPKLNDYLREDITAALSPQEMASALSQLESDDAFSIFEDLVPSLQTETLKFLSASQRTLFEELLRFPKNSAGRLMQREMVLVPHFWTVAQVLTFLSENTQLPNAFYDVFIIDPLIRPLGYLPLHKLVTASSSRPIEEVMEKNFQSISVEMDQEEVAHFFHHYHYVSAPVIESSGRIVGVITVDDVVEVIHEEATEDALKMAGVISSELRTSVFKTAMTRFRWLLVTFFSGLIASCVIYQFTETIQQIVAAAVLMPIVAGMGGNAAIQVVTVTVRALALGEFRIRRLAPILFKEFRVSLINGFLFATILSAVCSFWFEDYRLGAVLASALILNILWAGFAGSLIPIVLSRSGFDPADGAGPLITTTTDILGFSFFLGLVTLFLL